MRHFIHSGDLGDVIYSLPAVKAMGGGVMHLSDAPGVRTAHGMSRQRFDAIAPLLAAQPYICDVLPTQSGECIAVDKINDVFDLNEFRRRNVNLYDEWLPNHYLDVLGIDRGATVEPWLHVTSPSTGGVIFARSARYRNPRFPWRRVIERYGYIAHFIGTPAEHAAFNTEFEADVPYWHTNDLLDAARLIASCDMFVGNQSCPLAIAEGLKVPIVCEVCPACPNCNSPRPGFIQGWDENFRLPDLEELIHAVQERGPAPVHARQSP